MKQVAMLLSLLVVLAFLFQVAGDMRDFGDPHQNEPEETDGKNNYMDDEMIEQGQNDTGNNNIVTAVVFDYRGFDTLGEATVLFAAVSGVAMLFRRRIKAQNENEDQQNTEEGEQ